MIFEMLLLELLSKKRKEKILILNITIMGINKIYVLFSRPTDNVVCNIFSQFSNNDIECLSFI